MKAKRFLNILICASLIMGLPPTKPDVLVPVIEVFFIE